ncbi:MAG: hypothetical protein ABIV47_11340 [Roseiflexaceae bacterium]
MPRERTKSWVWVLAGCLLVLALLACVGPALLAREGTLPSFDADIQLWQDTTLTLHSRSARTCGTASRCPYQIKIQSALSIWLISKVHRQGNMETFGRRLLYIPAASQ